MSIIIKGMTMPKNCEECFFLGTDNNAHWYCYCQKKKISITSEKAYDSGCPLIELPPHGRLIDADALMENEENISYKDEWHMTVTEAFVSVKNIVDAPTIIESEGEE